LGTLDALMSSQQDNATWHDQTSAATIFAQRYLQMTAPAEACRTVGQTIGPALSYAMLLVGPDPNMGNAPQRLTSGGGRPL
jgi:hypothetical protein